jgi:O-antigen/teichoic acid export membrane protein
LTERAATAVDSTSTSAQAVGSLARRSSIVLLARVLGVGLSLGAGILTARALGPEGKGILAFLSTASALLVRAGSFGLDGSFTYVYIVRRHSLAECIGTSVRVLLGAAALGGAVTILALKVVPSLAGSVPSQYIVLYFAATPAYFFLFLVTFVFFALGREISFALFDIGYRLSLLVGLWIVLMALDRGVGGAVWLQVCVSVVFAAIALMWSARQAGWRLPFSAAVFSDALDQGGRYYIYSAARHALAYGGILLAAMLLSPGDAGIYSVSLMFGEALMLFTGSVSLSFYPLVAKTSDPQVYTRTVVIRILSMTTALGLALAVAAGPVVDLLYGEAFERSVPTFLWMLPGVLLLGVEQVLSSFFASRGMPWRIVAIVVGGAATAIALAVLLTRHGDVTRLALAVAVAQGATALFVVREFARAGSSASGHQEPLNRTIAG